MRILLTGATGYIGKRLLPLLLEQGHSVVCAVRDRARFALPTRRREQVEVVEVDFLDPTSVAIVGAASTVRVAFAVPQIIMAWRQGLTGKVP